MKEHGLDRRLGKIERAELRLEDRCFVLTIGLNFGNGSAQNFVSPSLGFVITKREETGAGMDFLRRILWLFRVEQLSQLSGRYCYALIGRQQTVVGLELLAPDVSSMTEESAFLESDWREYWFGASRGSSGAGQ